MRRRAGVGFTIALFITDLAFSDPVLRDDAKIGILGGSLVAALLGAWVLRVMGERTSLCSPASEAAPSALPPLPWSAPDLRGHPTGQAGGALQGPQVQAPVVGDAVDEQGRGG